MRLIAAQPQLRSVDAGLAGGALVAAGSAAVDLATGFRCPLYATTGCWCAFCGATRAVGQLVDGHPLTAARDNSLVMLVLALVAVRYLLMLTGRLGGRIDLMARTDRLVERVDIWVWVALLLAWTVVRNLPWFWFLGPAR